MIEAVGAAVGDGDDAAFHAAWMAAGDRLAAEAEAAGPGARASARRELWAAACYATSYHPLYGAPVDPRLVAAFRSRSPPSTRGSPCAGPGAPSASPTRHDAARLFLPAAGAPTSAGRW